MQQLLVTGHELSMNGLRQGKLKSLSWEPQREEQMLSRREGVWLAAGGFYCGEDACWQCSYTQAVKGCVKGDEHSLVSCGVQSSSSAQTRACKASHRQSMSSLLLCNPSLPWSTPAHASPSPFYFLLLSTGLNIFETGCFQMQSPSSSSVAFSASSSRGRPTWFAPQFHLPTFTKSLWNLLSPRQALFCIP